MINVVFIDGIIYRYITVMVDCHGKVPNWCSQVIVMVWVCIPYRVVFQCLREMCYLHHQGDSLGLGGCQRDTVKINVGHTVTLTELTKHRHRRWVRA
jgi:hypothetical protein